MKRHLRLAVVLACAAFLCSKAKAEDYVIPVDKQGNLPSDINLIGGDVFVATGTTAIGSTTPVVLYGYSVSSDVVTNDALLRDTNTLNTTSNIKLTLFPDGYSTAGAQTITAKLPIPVIFRNGLSINLASNVSGALGPSKGRWMFYVRYLREGALPGKTPTQADPRIAVDNLGVN